MKRPITLFAIALLASACNTSQSPFLEEQFHPLHKSSGETGDRYSYYLISGSDGVPSIKRSKKQEFEVATLGVRVRDINQELANSSRARTTDRDQSDGTVALTPWKGVFVNRVDGDSPAAEAGLKTGDVLLTFDGTPLSTSEQLKELLETVAEPGSQIDLTILERDEEKIYAAHPTALIARLGTKSVSVSKTDTFPLGSDAGIFHLSGLIVGTLPTELALEIYGSDEPVTLVVGSMLGSPAYMAGLRSGDRVVSCDGEPVKSYTDISRSLLARTDSAEFPLEWFDSAAREGSTGASGKVKLLVKGPLGTHEAAMGTVRSIKDSFQFSIPIVYDHYTDVNRTSWSFLDFIFQFGANYRSGYRRSETRSPRKHSSLSIFPFGMFEFETKGHTDTYRFFWFIRFEDKH